jgi:peptide chain release factor 1
MFSRLEETEKKYDELTELLSNPEIFNDQAAYQKNAKAQAAITEIVEVYREYKDISGQLKDTQALLEEETDPEMREFAQTEIVELKTRKENYEEKLKYYSCRRTPMMRKTLLMK